MLSGNSFRRTVYTHRASVRQAAKLVASLLRVARVTAGLVERNGSLLPGLWLMSPAGWLPRTGISSRTLRLAVDYGLRLLSLLMNIIVDITYLTSEISTNFHRILCEKCDVHHKPLCSEIDDYQLVFMTWQNPYVCVCVCVCVVEPRRGTGALSERAVDWQQSSVLATHRSAQRWLRPLDTRLPRLTAQTHVSVPACCCSGSSSSRSTPWVH